MTVYVQAPIIEQVHQRIEQRAVVIGHPRHGNDREPTKPDANPMELSKHATSSKQRANAPAETVLAFAGDRRRWIRLALLAFALLDLRRLDSGLV